MPFIWQTQDLFAQAVLSQGPWNPTLPYENASLEWHAARSLFNAMWAFGPRDLHLGEPVLSVWVSMNSTARGVLLIRERVPTSFN